MRGYEHGYECTLPDGSKEGLYVGTLPARKSKALYIDAQQQVEPLAYFVSDEAAIKCLLWLDKLWSGMAISSPLARSLRNLIEAVREYETDEPAGPDDITRQRTISVAQANRLSSALQEAEQALRHYVNSTTT